MEDNRDCESWQRELLDEVRNSLLQASEKFDEELPRFTDEKARLKADCEGWAITLAKGDLHAGLRSDLERRTNEAYVRIAEIDERLASRAKRVRRVDDLVSPSKVMERLDRLAELLASQEPTMANLELSLHIDRISCSQNGVATVRLCRLGVLTEAIGLLAEGATTGLTANESPSPAPTDGRARGPRRRAQLRTMDGVGDDADDLEELARFVADTDRFADLGDVWFEEVEFRIPEKVSWARTNAEAVFCQRQQSKKPLGALAKEFGVSRPTITAAINHYEAENPGVKDEVSLPRGGKRPKQFDLAELGDQAWDKWANQGVSKLKLAEAHGCSPPTIDKALRFVSERDGHPMPTDAARRNAAIDLARKMYDEKASQHSIANELGVVVGTVRKYLKISYAREGKKLEDGRTTRHRRADSER